MVGGSFMQRSVNRCMDSTLSQRLSAIPKERASTVLSSIDDSSKQDALKDDLC